MRSLFRRRRRPTSPTARCTLFYQPLTLLVVGGFFSTMAALILLVSTLVALRPAVNEGLQARQRAAVFVAPVRWVAARSHTARTA